MTNADLDILVQEIRNLRNSTLNAIITRRDHPTYGHSKASIRERMAHLEGMLFAWWIVTGGIDPQTGSRSLGSSLLATRMAYALLFDGENIDDLRQKVEAA